MSTIAELEEKLSIAVSKQLIEAYDHTIEDSFISVTLNMFTSQEVKQQLREHIRERYKFVNWVSFGTGVNKQLMFLQYTAHKAHS